jgi:hypothetical protein
MLPWRGKACILSMATSASARFTKVTKPQLGLFLGMLA